MGSVWSPSIMVQVTWHRNWRRCSWKRPWPNLSNYIGICLGCRKDTQTSYRIVDVPAEIRNENLPNTSLSPFCFLCLLIFISFHLLFSFINNNYNYYNYYYYYRHHYCCFPLLFPLSLLTDSLSYSSWPSSSPSSSAPLIFQWHDLLNCVFGVWGGSPVSREGELFSN